MSDRVTKAERLTALVRPYLPMRVPPEAPSEWDTLAPALLARMTGTVEAMIQLRPLGRTADEIVLGRSLFDHATTFAWLAADPAARLPHFLYTDAVERLKLHNHCKELGIEMLGDEARLHFSSIRDAAAGDMPSLLRRAQQADSDWEGRLPEYGSAEFMTFVGKYATFYRHQSGFEHTSTLGLLTFAQAQPDGGWIVSMEEGEDDAMIGTGVILYAWSLWIAAERLGWPSEEKVIRELWQWRQERSD